MTTSLWAETQRDIAARRADAAFWIPVQQERGAALQQINDTFERYKESDFGRKLYLIQRWIFGVDNDPNATEIAKLRFFISLAIEQQTNADPGSNFGIHPLPNLETRFVTADSLLGLEKPAQPPLSEHAEPILRIERRLVAIREERFHARTRREKERMRVDDQRLRGALAKRLEEAAFPPDDARKIAAWDPADQSIMADTRDATVWFEPEFMFGVRDGFDIVISNPPYAQLQKDGGRLRRLYKDAGYETFVPTGDIYQLFYERGTSLLRDGGILCFISSNQWMRVNSGKALRQFLGNLNPVRLVNLGAGAFDSVTVNTCVMVISRSPNENALQAADVRQRIQQFPPDDWNHIRPVKGETWTVMPATEQRIKAKMEAAGTPLAEWAIKINYGIKTGYNKAFLIDDATRDALVSGDPRSAEIIRPVLRGRDIRRWRAKWAGLWMIATFPSLQLDIDDFPGVKSHLLTYGKDRLEQHGKTLPDGSKSRKRTRNAWFEVQDSIAYHEEFAKEKIAWGNLNNRAKFAYITEGTCINAPTTMLTPYSHHLLAMLNSTLLDWYFQLIGVERDGGYFEYKPMFIERLPIPKISASNQRPFINLVDRILAAKNADPSADTSDHEAEIDRLVYDLYGLTDAEVAELGAWRNRSDKEKRA